MSRKAQGLSLNAIVIALIVLVVLIILIGLTTGYFSNWREKFGRVSDTSCKGQGGQEKASCDPAIEQEILHAQVANGMMCCAQKSCEGMGGQCLSTCPENLRFPSGDRSCGLSKCCKSS